MQTRSDRYFIRWGFVIFGIPALALVYQNQSEPKASRAPVLMQASPVPVLPPGKEGFQPDFGVMQLFIEKTLRQNANDPGSVQDVEVYAPAKDLVGKVPCWRIAFRYRAKNGFGALALAQGSLWIREGIVIKQRWS